MGALGLHRVIDFLTAASLAVWLLWAGMVSLTVAIVLLSRTRWGQSKPLRKCLVLSVLAHALFFAYASTVNIVASCERLPKGSVIRVSLSMNESTEGPAAEQASPDKQLSDENLVTEPPIPSPQAPPPNIESRTDPPPSAVAEPEPISDLPPGKPDKEIQTPPEPLPEAIVEETPERELDLSSRALPQPQQPVPSAHSPFPARLSAAPDRPVPEAYRLRTAPGRTAVARARGSSPETEAAVEAALEWLAENQESDGRWNPRAHEGGVELKIAGRDRGGAGSRADTGMTGLALLAFLASGHTHREGMHQQTVTRGIDYLLRTQTADGGLGGEAAVFEYMYCHAMATIGLAEAYGMTDDSRLEYPVRQAAVYSLKAQNPISGGWRYQPGDVGDTSQTGWQLMALKSAELAGIRVPAETWPRIRRFLDGVSSGTHGGMAAYRSGERASRPMTAEALFCRQFIGLLPQHPAVKEASLYLMGELPGMSRPNFYYWYYGTLAMYQAGGEEWDRWNQALQATLLASQEKNGPLAGSWDATCVWGCYGGRIYTTALATLSLEVYYRFLPLYVAAGPADRALR